MEGQTDRALIRPTAHTTSRKLEKQKDRDRLSLPAGVCHPLVICCDANWPSDHKQDIRVVLGLEDLGWTADGYQHGAEVW